MPPTTSHHVPVACRRARATAAWICSAVGSGPMPLTSQSREMPSTATIGQSVFVSMLVRRPSSMKFVCPGVNPAMASRPRAESPATNRALRSRFAIGGFVDAPAMAFLIAVTFSNVKLAPTTCDYSGSQKRAK